MSEIPKNFICEYIFKIAGEMVIISKYDNHRNFIKDGKWAVCWIRGECNPWYLGENGEWHYKVGCTFHTAEDAYEHCLQFPPSKSSYKEE